MNNTDFLNKMTELQNDYYETNGKNILFKKSQKVECANVVSNSFDIQQLLRYTMFIIPNTNKVYFDYTVFKMYGNHNNYKTVVDYAIALFCECTCKYGTYEIHINLNTFTVSACERHKDSIKLLMDECLRNETTFSTVLTIIYIYYPPHAIDTIQRIVSPFMDPLVRSKIVIIPKAESDNQLKMLLSS